MKFFEVALIFVIVLVTQQARAGPVNGHSGNDYFQPEARNLLGDVLGGFGTGLGDLANAITSLGVQKKSISPAEDMTT